MPNSPSPSFIPKQPSTKRSRQGGTRQIHLFSVIVYLLFFTTLVSSVGVFFYKKHVVSQKNEAVASLDAAIANFSDLDMERVREFNVRLMQAEDRIENAVSGTSIFDALEAATLKSVGIVDLKLEREGDEQYVVEAEVDTDTFDSALFQRGVFERNEAVDTIEINELGINSGTEEDPGDGVSFKAILHVPMDTVRYEPEGQVSIPEVATESSSSTASTTEEQGGDADVINSDN